MDQTEQFEYERTAASRLLAVSEGERSALYLSVYEEFYRRFEANVHKDGLKYQIAFLARFLRRGVGTFVEIGSGSGQVCIAVAPHAEQVIGIDAAADRDSTKVVPSNCRFFIRDIVSPFIPENSADIVYSNQVLEHLHPDDCMKVISNAFSALKPGGLFINIVPNWLTGPHDVSRHFTVRAEGLHLHEYDNRELSQILRNAGFRRCRSYVGKTGMCFPVPAVIVGSIEAVLENLPRSWRRNFVVRGITGIRMVATKP